MCRLVKLWLALFVFVARTVRCEQLTLCCHVVPSVRINTIIIVIIIIIIIIIIITWGEASPTPCRTADWAAPPARGRRRSRSAGTPVSSGRGRRWATWSRSPAPGGCDAAPPPSAPHRRSNTAAREGPRTVKHNTRILHPTSGTLTTVGHLIFNPGWQIVLMHSRIHCMSMLVCTNYRLHRLSHYKECHILNEVLIHWSELMSVTWRTFRFP